MKTNLYLFIYLCYKFNNQTGNNLNCFSYSEHKDYLNLVQNKPI